MSTKKKSPPPPKSASPKKNELIVPQIDSQKKEEKKEEIITLKKTDAPNEKNLGDLIKVNMNEIEQKLAELNAKNKIVVIIDKTKAFSTFIKFKGYFADLHEFSMLWKNGKGKKENFMENWKNSLIKAIYNNKIFGILLEDELLNVKEFFKNEKILCSDEFFFASSYKNKDFLVKNNLLVEGRPEEHDNLEKKNEIFQLCVVLYSFCEDLAKILGEIGFSKENASVVEIDST
jgi:hypothetical protein